MLFESVLQYHENIRDQDIGNVIIFNHLEELI